MTLSFHEERRNVETKAETKKKQREETETGRGGSIEK